MNYKFTRSVVAKTMFMAFALLGLLFAVSQTALGQTEVGTIVGTVTDQAGAVVPDAAVTVVNIGTGATRVTNTDDRGGYIFTNLLPAVYAVAVEAKGFGKAEKRIQVTVGAKLALDFTVLVGSVVQTVEVFAEAGVAVNTETQTLSTEIDSKKLLELPLLTRNAYDLVGLSGNVARDDQTARGAGFVINGLRSAGTNVLLDGAANNDEFVGAIGISVPLDSVQEFSVLTNNFTAEFGRADAGIVNVVTKSGSNALHGTAYEFGRYSRVGTNSFDNNANGLKRPVYTRNQFGYSVGGPIIKDKLFFFSSTEWLRARSSRTEIKEIPDAAFIAASAPATQAFFTAFGALRPNARTLQTFTQAQVCAAIACSGAIGALAPTTPIFDEVTYDRAGDSGGGLPTNDTNTVGRVDWVASSKTQIYGRYASDKGEQFPGTVSHSPYAGFDTGTTFWFQSALGSITHTWGPHWITQSKLEYNRFNLLQPLGKNPVSPTLFFRDSVAATFNNRQIGLPGYLPFSPGNGIPFGGPQNLAQAYQDVTVIKGAHTFRFGGNYTFIQDNRAFGAYEEAVEALDSRALRARGLNRFLSGQLLRMRVAVDPQGEFPCQTSSNPLVKFSDPSNAAAIANPACNIPTPVSPPGFTRSNRFHEFGFYGQDSWKFNRRLTLNLGVRWEYFGVQHNKDASKDSNYYDGLTGNLVNRIRQGDIEIAPQSRIGGLWEKDWNNFAPRLGFAWDVFGNGKTAIRGGYGIAYERNFGNVTFNVIQNPPNYAVLQLDFIPIQTANFGPLTGNIGTQPIRNTSARNVKSNIRTAYAHLWSLTIEREVYKNVTVGVDYSGSKGVKLYSLENPNRAGSGNFFGLVPRATCNAGAGPIDLFGDGFGECADRIRNTQFTALNRRGNSGDSDYGAVVARVSGNNIAGTGLTLSYNYTYSHAIDNLSSTFSESNNNFNLGLTDPFHPRLDRGSADFDVKHRSVLSAIWTIPYAKNTTGIWKKILDGWEVSSIYTAQTGNPFTIFDCSLIAFEVCPRLFQVGPISRDGSGSRGAIAGVVNQFSIINVAPTSFDSTYRDPITGLSEFGPFPKTMTARNFFRGPGLWNVDFGVHKSTRITERITAQFRAEFLNAFNHSNLYFIGEDQDISVSTGFDPVTGLPSPALNSLFQAPARKGITPTQNTIERRSIQFALKLIF